MTKMEQIGEKAFLAKLLPSLATSTDFVNGFGHDASIIDLGLEKNIAFKIDRAPVPVSIRRGLGDYRTWGRLAVVANISDLLAVGAEPRAMMLSLVLPKDFQAEDATAIIEGCEDACSIHGLAFLGGDTKEGPAPQVVGAALGVVTKGAEFGRTPARPGDSLFLAGNVGGFTGTLELMAKSTGNDPISRTWLDVLERPSARVFESRYLRESLAVAGACDLSDGLADALDVFCAEGTGITIFEGDLPMHAHALQASRLAGAPLWRFALGVGDWAIAFVVRENDTRQFKLGITPGLQIAEVGRFNDTGRRLVLDSNSTLHVLPRIINEQFRQRLEDDGDYLTTLLASFSRDSLAPKKSV